MTTNLTKFYEDTQRVANPEEFLKNFTNCNVLSTVSQEENEEQWLANRSLGVGGSDIGTICGVNNYSTARLLYFKKTGQYEDSDAFKFSETSLERMGWGHKLEPIVADEYMARTGNRIVICPATLQHKDFPWRLANVDRIIVDENEKPIGILEVKTTDSRMAKNWEEGEIPISYIYQLQWYLDILDLDFGAFATLVGGNQFVMIDVVRNKDLLAEMNRAGDTFWNHNVKNMIEPEISGSEADGKFNKELYSEVEKGSEVTLAEEEDDELAAFIVEGKALIKATQKDVDMAIHKLQSKMMNSEIGHTNGHTLKWSPRMQQRLDSDKLKVEYPEIYDKCRKTLKFRVFSVK